MSFPQSPALRIAVIFLILLAGLGASLFVEYSAVKSNGGPGFPLDDPWIHLQFARNLHDFGSYSYYQNLMVTSGSTSPLYTFLLAGGFFLTRNEMLLSYILGILFLLSGAAAMGRLALDLWEGVLPVAASAMLLFLVEPRLQWAALSGMETTLFVFLLLATFLFYRLRKPVPLGLAAGLLIWARPEALIFVAALILDVLYNAFWVRRPHDRKKDQAEATRSLHWLRLPLILFLALGAAYAAFNLLLSGSVMPNTYAAKLAYYSAGGSSFPKQVFHYLTDGHMAVFAWCAGAGIVALVLRAAGRRPNPMLVPLAWSVAMFLAYWKDLPYLYQQGRYLMPVLPFVLLMGIDGVMWLLSLVKKGTDARRSWAQIAAAALGTLFLYQFAAALIAETPAYAEQCRYITDRQVRTARWIRSNLSPQAVVATHDIGAIAYYSGRRIADMVGLVSPEMISGIGRYDRLQEFLARQGVTHLALLRNWFDVSDQNPLYLTDEQSPEIMEVFAYEPAKTRFASAEDHQLENAATMLLARGNPNAVVRGLERYFLSSSGTARLHALQGQAYLMTGNLDQAAREFQRANERCPGYLDAELGISEIDRQRGDDAGAITCLDSLVRAVPTYAAAYRQLARVYEEGQPQDTARAREALVRYGAVLRKEGE